MNYFDDEYPAKMTELPTGKKDEKIRHDSSKHYPNKDEAQKLRKKII